MQRFVARLASDGRHLEGDALPALPGATQWHHSHAPGVVVATTGVKTAPWAQQQRHLGLLCGRLDNRAELIALVGLTDDATDAALALATELRFGANGLGRLLGSFCLLIVRPDGAGVSLVRDALGDRSACYRALDDGWLIASDESLLIGKQDMPALCQGRIVQHFAIHYPHATHTCFHGVQEIAPAHAIHFHQGRLKRQRYWTFCPNPAYRKLDHDQASEILRTLMDQAVENRLPYDQAIGVAVSGGMDSPPIAAAAAAALGKAAAQRLKLFCYAFDQFNSCDERIFAQALADRLGVPLSTPSCDQGWPLSAAFHAVPQLMHEPSVDAYRAVRARLFEQAKEQEVTILLSGDFGDQLYAGYGYFLRDLFSDGQWRKAWRLARERRKGQDWPGWRRDPAWRRLLPANGITRGWRRQAPPWLQPDAAKLLWRPPRQHAFLGGVYRLDRVEGCINTLTAKAAQLGHLHAGHYGIDLRFPLRDRRLVEFFLSIAAYHLLHPNGTTKSIMRQAYAQRLPASIIQRQGKTQLTPLFKYGLFEREREQVEDLLYRPQASWQQYVQPGWLQHHLRQDPNNELTLTVLWQCLSYELWRQQL